MLSAPCGALPQARDGPGQLPAEALVSSPSHDPVEAGCPLTNTRLPTTYPQVWTTIHRDAGHGENDGARALPADLELPACKLLTL